MEAAARTPREGARPPQSAPHPGAPERGPQTWMRGDHALLPAPRQLPISRITSRPFLTCQARAGKEVAV